jgi:hypothetical protein
MLVPELNRKVIAFVATVLLVRWFLPGGPQLIPFPSYKDLTLYHSEVVWNEATATMTFATSGSPHSNYPLSYVFSRVLQLLIPQPVIDEFLIGMVVTIILLSITMSIWMKKYGSTKGLFVIFGFGALILYYAVGGQLWFNSIAAFELLVLVSAFPFILTNIKRGSILFAILILAIVLSDDGIITYLVFLYMLVGLLLSSKLRPQLWRLLRVGILIQLAYQAAVALSGPIYYSAYLSTLTKEYLAFLSPSTSNLQAHISSVGLPPFQLWGLIAASLALFAVIPLFLLLYGGKMIRYMIPAFLLLGLGDLARLSNVLTPSVYFIGAFYIVVLYGFVPIAIFGGLHASGNFEPHHKTTQGHRNQFFAVVFVLSLVSSWFLYVPLVSYGPVTNSTDPRISYVYLFDAQVYAARYSPGRLLGSITDFNLLLINSSATGPPVFVGYAIGGPFWAAFNSSYPNQVYFSNSIALITN